MNSPNYLAQLPNGYLDIMSHGQEQVFDFSTTEGKHLLLWPLAELTTINEEYQAAKNYPGFLLIGTYGIGEACAIEKETGFLYTIPFIGSIPEDAEFVGKSIADLLEYLQQDW